MTCNSISAAGIFFGICENEGRCMEKVNTGIRR